MQGPRRRYGWRCNPIGYQPNYAHIPNEKAWNLREAVFLKIVCAAPGDHLVGALCRIVGFRRSPIKGNVKRNTSPSARCRYFVRHSAQLFERALSIREWSSSSRIANVAPAREAQERFLFPVVPYSCCDGAIRF